MASNMTYQHKLVEELPLSGYLSGGKPVGREGFEVIVMERIGTGSRYYCTLAPGDTLRISERLFGSFYAYIVDMRPARVLEVNEQLPTTNPLIKVKVSAKALYRVVNARRVAVEVDDPLSKFSDRIRSALRREVSQLPHQKLSEIGVERIILNIGTVQPLGLAVEGVDLVVVEHDSQVLRGIQQRAELDYNRGLGQELADETHNQAVRRQQQQQELQRRELDAQLERDGLQRLHDIEMQGKAINAFNLRDLNTLLHIRPELTQAIFDRLTTQEQMLLENRLAHDNAFRVQMLKVVDNFVRNNEDARPEEVVQLIREIATQSNNIGGRITWGSAALPPVPNQKNIAFGKVVDGEVVEGDTPIPTQDDELV